MALGGERLPSEWMGEYPINAAHGPGISQWLSVVLKKVERKEIGMCIGMSVNYKKMASPEEGQKNGRP